MHAGYNRAEYCPTNDRRLHMASRASLGSEQPFAACCWNDCCADKAADCCLSYEEPARGKSLLESRLASGIPDLQPVSPRNEISKMWHIVLGPVASCGKRHRKTVLGRVAGWIGNADSVAHALQIGEVL